MHPRHVAFMGMMKDTLKILSPEEVLNYHKEEYIAHSFGC
jgi:hypothetical protein